MMRPDAQGVVTFRVLNYETRGSRAGEGGSTDKS
jgi:hypothetical protein